jgi:hypothetical protein
MLHLEKMKPQVPVRLLPKYPSQTTTKMAACEMELGAR